MNLRAKRPPPTSRAPAPSANSEAALVPPVFGSAFFFSAFGALAGEAFGAGAGAAFAGAGVGAGAAFGGGGGAGAALGGSGSHGASATTAGSSWARAGEAASRATATIAASNINFLILTYLLMR